MKKILLLVLLFVSVGATAQLMHGTYYVAAKTGLSMRETADAGSKMLEKIPYGTKVVTLDEEAEWKSITTESLEGYWKKVKYNNKTGYIVDSYLLPWPPPKLATVKTLKQYLAQAGLFGQKLVARTGSMATESGWEISKQLYKNGAEYHEFSAYEYGSTTYFLPGFSLQQGFLLCRLIPEFAEVFGEKDEFPTADKKFKKGEREFEIRLIKTNADEEEYSGPYSLAKIIITYEDGAYYEFEMYMLNNQLVIFFGAGV